MINLTQGQLAVLRCSLGLHALSLEAVQPKAVLATGTSDDLEAEQRSVLRGEHRPSRGVTFLLLL